MAQALREILGQEPSTASPNDSILIIIDAQNEYASGQLKTHNVSSTRAAISSLLTKYRKASAPVVHVVHQVPAGAPVFTPDTALAQEFDELVPKDGEKVIGKGHPGSFTGTDLDDWIQREGQGRKKLVLTGYMAHVCVSTTARQADERGYEVVLAEGAIGDRDIPGVDAETLVKISLAELADAFGTIVKADDIK